MIDKDNKEIGLALFSSALIALAVAGGIYYIAKPDYEKSYITITECLAHNDITGECKIWKSERHNWIP